MFRPKVILPFITALFYVQNLHAIEQKTNLQTTLDSVMHTANKNSPTNVHIVCAKTHKTLYSKNMHHCCTPASTLKLFTVAAALDILGPDYRFETNLSIDGTIKHGTLKGNVYLKGSGDPSLYNQDLAALVDALKKAGIKKIVGDFVVDVSEFDEVLFGPGWSWDDPPALWNSALTALNINHNCIEVIVDPQADTFVSLNPATSFVVIENKAIVVPTKTRADKPISVTRLWRDKKNIAKVTGTIAAHSAPKSYFIALKNPIAYVAALCHELLMQEDIQLKGSFKKGMVPTTAKLLASHASEPLAELIQPVFKNSDNLYADALFKKMGAQLFGAPGSWEKGSKAIIQFLETHALFDTNNITIADGSGKSRYSLVSPAQLTKLLAWIQAQPYYDLFFDALPHAGVDGFLQKRMTKPATKNRVHAKTGTLRKVSSLAGYVSHKEQPVIFAMNSSNFAGPAKVYRTLEDNLCTVLATHQAPQKAPQRKRP